MSNGNRTSWRWGPWVTTKNEKRVTRRDAVCAFAMNCERISTQVRYHAWCGPQSVTVLHMWSSTMCRSWPREPRHGCWMRPALACALVRAPSTDINILIPERWRRLSACVLSCQQAGWSVATSRLLKRCTVRFWGRVAVQPALCCARLPSAGQASAACTDPTRCANNSCRSERLRAQEEARGVGEWWRQLWMARCCIPNHFYLSPGQ